MRQVHRTNRAVRDEVLGERRPELTVLPTGHGDERGLLEIEAIGAMVAA
jgi:hypothetical protein